MIIDLSGLEIFIRLDGRPVEGIEVGILFAEEAAGMSLAGAELVVLAACETAPEETNNGEGVFGLRRAFKLAGADHLS